MKNVIKDALILFVITLFAGFCLALVNEITAPKIEASKEKQKKDACVNVFEDASNFELISDSFVETNSSKITCNEIYIAKDDSNQVLGYVLNMSTKEGYGSEISFMIGIKNDRTINAVSILSSSETVGLGLEADKVLVPQFKNKKVESFTYTKLGSKNDSEIDAISSATITTNAFVNAVNESLLLFDSIIEKGGI